jgi:hypothetical protein
MDPTSIPFIAAFANLSAVAIMGIFFCYIWPKMLDKMTQATERMQQQLVALNEQAVKTFENSQSQLIYTMRDERRANNEALMRLSESLEKLAVSMPTMCHANNSNLPTLRAPSRPPG